MGPASIFIQYDYLRFYILDGNCTTLNDFVLSALKLDIPLRLQNDEKGQNLTKKKTTKNELIFDEDGDLIVDRKDVQENVELVITLEHQLSTNLANVGNQMWRGSFYLSDYLFHLREKELKEDVDQKNRGVWLELGAGTGMVSIIASMMNRDSEESLIYATDLPEIVPLIKRNIERNGAPKSVSVIPFDLIANDIPQCISERDLELILAADIIYDNSLTKGIVGTIYALILKQLDRHHIHSDKKSKKLLTCYFSVEKRYNFTIDNMEVAAPAYDYFIKCLDDLSAKTETFGRRLKVSYTFIDTNFEQRFCYERCKDVVIIRIDAVTST